MNCQEFEELSGAYAIGALPEDERASADAHLASCDKHPDFADLRAVANGLALASPEMEPPAHLKARLMDAIREESAEAGEWEPKRARRSLGQVLGGWFGNVRVGYGMAGALAIVVAALLVWNISLQSNDSNALVVDMTGQVTGQLVYVKEKKVAVMDLHGMDDLPSGKVYELWGMSKGTPTALGTLVPTNGTANAALSFDADVFDTVAVTIEAAPGVDAPTTQPITSGSF